MPQEKKTKISSNLKKCAILLVFNSRNIYNYTLCGHALNKLCSNTVKYCFYHSLYCVLSSICILDLYMGNLRLLIPSLFGIEKNTGYKDK